MFRKLLFTLILFFPFTVFAQEGNYAKDNFRLAFTFGRTDIPLYNEKAEVENVNGFTIEADRKIIKSGNFRLSVAYNFNRKLNQEVYPHYYDGKNIVDLYRDVNTHSVGAQAGYAIEGAVEPFVAIFYGSRKIHEVTPYQLVRNVKFGVNIPFSKKSPLFARVNINYDQPYGELPMGFINPYNRTLEFGFGFRF